VGTLTVVVNRRTDKFDVYIGRPSLFGNPFKIGRDRDRDQVIKKFKDYFYRRLEVDSTFKRGVLNLKGCRLGCYCKPDACHGDIIAEYLNGVK
jgi:hypothetical protein